MIQRLFRSLRSKRRSGVLLGVLLCGATITAAADSLLIVPGRGVGPFHAGMARSEIAKLLKPEELGEGEEGGRATLTVYFMEPSKRIALQLDARGRVAAMVLHGDKSQWHDARGIGLGTPLSTLEKLNGKPISVHGFDASERAGQVLGFGGGKLAKELTGVKLTFASPMHAAGYGKLSEAQKLEIEKERDFLSTDAALQKLEPVIETIVLKF